MHAPDKLPATPFALSREPFPASRKLHVPGQLPGVRVPMREIALTNGERVVVYDTSGPYSEPAAAIDVTRGLPDVRGAWIAARGDTETYAGRARQVLDDYLHALDQILPRLTQANLPLACQIAELPKTISGKIRRVELRQMEVLRRQGDTRGEHEHFEEDFVRPTAES